MENAFRNFNGMKLCIDHHQDPEDFVNHFFGGTNYSATGEIIFDFIEQTKIVEFDKRIAELLYAAIMTDTGSFRFERTSPKIHRIAARLLEYDVNPTEIYDKIYNQFLFGRVKLLGETLSTIQIDSTKQIAYMEITKADLERNLATEADIDGFVNYCLSIKDIKIGILFYELKDGIKISFRSKGEIPVNKLAYEFNGGGHMNASGARLFNITINDIKEKVISSAQNYLNHRG
jgi:phosphoesterase RecJ-like protein